MTDEQEDDGLSQHDDWVLSWQAKFREPYDGAPVDTWARSLINTELRISTDKGKSDDHPDEKITVTGTLVGFGQDRIFFSSEYPVAVSADRGVSRTSLVLDNGHAYLLKPGMTVESRQDRDSVWKLRFELLSD